MAELTFDESVVRFKENEVRFDEFVNDAVGYLTREGVSVESIQAFLARLETEILGYTDLGPRVTTLEGEMTAVEGRATALEGEMTTAQGDIATAEVDLVEVKRRTLTPWFVSLYEPTPLTGFVLTLNAENKVAATVIPPTGIVPDGFDLFTTLEGPAIRFIGSGLGNGDSAIFSVVMHMGITTTTGAATATFNCLTRPYTETAFANATIIPGCSVSRKMANGDTGAMAIAAPLIILNDGDLLELSINPDSGITVSLEQISATILEVKGA